MSLIDDSSAGVMAISTAEPRDYLALVKPRVMQLVVITALAGILLAPHPVNFVIGLSSLLCIAVGAGASGALNMWYDADIDAVMRRTAKRPIPTGRVTRPEVLAFGIILSGFAVLTLYLVANALAAALLAFTIFFYVVIYTMWLKRATPQNIVIGGAAGRAAADRRLRRRDGAYRCRAARSLRSDLRLDAAAFLGAGASAHDRLRQCRRADDAERQRRRSHAARDSHLQL